MIASIPLPVGSRQGTQARRMKACSLFGRLVADGWCWFILREEYCWLVVGGWFVVREKYCWLVADNPSEQGDEAVKRSPGSWRWIGRQVKSLSQPCGGVADWSRREHIN
jgi:hypothetical protein